MAPVLEVRDLRVHAARETGAEQPIVKGVSLAVEPGEVVALIGESGSGKTTIALSALAYCRPGLRFAGGEVRLNGTDLLTLPALRQREIRGREVAYLAQSAAATFNPALPIGEQVTEPAVVHGVLAPRAAEARARELYRQLELPDPERLGRRYPHQVSGGQLQRLMAAMALCGKPALLVLDEPTTALDVTTQIEVLKAFKKVIRDQGAAALYVSHDLAVVAQIADHVVVLNDGEVRERGPIRRILDAPRHDYTRRLLAAVRPAPGATARQARLADKAPPALALEGVNAGYGKIVDGGPRTPVLHDIDLAVGRGQVVGVIGESGCGKSTLARVMAGLLPAARGRLLLDGKPLHPALERRSREELRRIQIVFQMADTALNPRQRLHEILGRPLAFYHGFHGARAAQRIAELLDMVELPQDFANRYPGALSGGQKQRVNLARALAAEPEILLCDEVTSALDTIVGANIIALLRRLRQETGIAFVFISHDLSTVAAFADQIVVLYAGRVVERGPAAAVLSPPYHPYTRLLVASVPELRVGWLEATAEARAAATAIGRPVEQVEAGCPFYARCPLAIEGTCNREAPPLRRPAADHSIACHRVPSELDEAAGRSVARAAGPIAGGG